MSTICGILSDRTNSEGLVTDGTLMMSYHTRFPFDAANVWHDNMVFLGNTLKFDTPESKYEILPRYLKSGNLAITADAIIDNREFLLKEFNMPLNKAHSIPDSELILLSYIKWKKECPKYLIGDFAFAIWDDNLRSLFCARDHVGKRTLYYLHEDGRLAFSTTIKPLVALRKNCSKLNNEWIADNLATAIPLNQLSTSNTVYDGILQLPPAHFMYVSDNGLKIEKYWFPMQVKKLKLKNNEEYEEAFRKIFFEAVRCRLRSIDSIGILLSSGLDSGSVACIAASILNKEFKNLKAFTSVPVKDYKNYLSSESLADESTYIESILSQYKNIDVLFSDSVGINSYNSMARLVSILEFPYKYVQNFFWIDNLTALAKRNNCSVLLDGQYGNYTVSSGNIQNFFCSMISKGKFIKAVTEAKYYSIVNRRNYVSVLKHLFLLLLPDRIVKMLRRSRADIGALELEPIINPRLAEIYNIENKLKKYGLGRHIKKNSSIEDMNKFSAESLLLTQSAEAEVKTSLIYGLVRRDPTRDKRVIEFCMSLPEEQLVQGGIERSIIRRAMKGVLPDKIRLNYAVRGAQSADWIQRLKAEWPNIREEFYEALEDVRLIEFIDVGLVRSLISDTQDMPTDDEYEKMQMILNVIMWRRFIVMNENDVR